MSPRHRWEDLNHKPKSNPLSTDGHCIGFGEFEDVCENAAGDSPWSKLWCIRCDRLRLAHITTRMESITKSLSSVLDEEVDG